MRRAILKYQFDTLLLMSLAQAIIVSVALWFVK